MEKVRFRCWLYDKSRTGWVTIARKFYGKWKLLLVWNSEMYIIFRNLLTNTSRSQVAQEFALFYIIQNFIYPYEVLVRLPISVLGLQLPFHSESLVTNRTIYLLSLSPTISFVSSFQWLLSSIWNELMCLCFYLSKYLNYSVMNDEYQLAG